MSRYVVSQAERWFRNFNIEAADKDEALLIYKKYLCTDDTNLLISVDEPQYLNDIEDDIEVWEEYTV